LELLERLTIKEISIKIPLSTDLIRLEADFYTSNSVAYKKSLKGAEIIDFVQYGTSEELNEDGIGYPVLRLNEFDLNFIKNPSKYSNKITKSTYESLKLLKNDVLICRTNGNPKLVGKSAIVPDNYEFAYASYLFKIRPKSNLINSSTLVSFLNSKIGRLEIEKHSMVGNQANFSPAKFREINIPIFEKTLNDKIEILNYKAYDLLVHSQNLYSKAELLLLKEIGINNKITSLKSTEITSINVKSFKESFGKHGRIDAEYYQPKYEHVIDKIKSYRNGFEPLVIACNLKDKNYSPKENQEYNYIELSNIGKTGDINGSITDFGQNLPSRARRKVAIKDVIISSIEGSLQSCALVGEEYNNALCSTGFFIINSEKINSETLIVLFKSELIQSIMKRNCSGTILTGMNKEEFQNILVPLIDIEVQQQIAKLIDESFSLKKQTEHLLEVAKRAVEIAIEENEETAIKYIENNSTI
jgi:type I restriction enzyme, S subunit